MVSLRKDIKINLNKFLDFVISKDELYINEKIIYYIRLYTDLVRAEENLAGGFNRMLNYLRIVRNMAKQATFREEEVYFQRIYDIAHEIIGNQAKIRRAASKLKPGDAYSDPLGARTRMQLAQNICILRVMKREVK
ncbi:hypothetical protein GOV09_00710 [Candidatus Woesearchaeota archaeon]|nr:hypothetical protein [Candidatus Woesearchaeota archaeon]